MTQDDLRWQIAQFERIYRATGRFSAGYALWTAKAKLARARGDKRGMGEAARQLMTMTPEALRQVVGRV